MSGASGEMVAARQPTELERQSLAALRKLRERLAALEGERSEPLAIVGVGCRFPGASGPQAFWDLLARGGDAVSRIPQERWDASRIDGVDASVLEHAGVLENVDRFDAEFFGITGREALLLDPQQRLLLEVVWEALENAGIPPTQLKGSDTGVFIGATTTDYLRVITRQVPVARLDAYVAPGNTLNAMAGRVSYLLGLHGPCIAMDTACSSSLVAIDRACRSVRDAECRLAIAGGVNLLLSPEFLVSLSRWGMLAPDGRCKTFDAAANGFVRAEGCGVVLLKRLSHAVADGDRIWALIRGSAVNQDGASSGLTVPNGLAQAAVIRAALANARVDARVVGHVEAHGTGTTLGDPIEMEALAAVYGADRAAGDALWVGAAKTNLGHMEAASGVAGVIKTVLALQRRQVPPVVHFKTPSPHIPWESMAIRVPARLEPWAALGGRRLAAVSAFGFSGTNAHVVLEEAPPPGASGTPLMGQGPLLLTLSARSPAGLRNLAEAYAQRLRDVGPGEAAAVCLSTSAGRSHLPHRLALVADDVESMRSQLRLAIGRIDGGAGDEVDPSIQIGTATGTRGGIAFLFTGQGSQYLRMGMELHEREPVFRAAFDRCAAVMDPLLERPLRHVLEAATDADIHRTGFTQPALFALQWALAELWKSRGVVPTVVLGHSIGEFAAACVAGVLRVEDAARIVVARGRLMQALPAGGAMAAIAAAETVVRRVIDSIGGRVEIAAVNASDECVVSGDVEDVARVTRSLQRDGVRCDDLHVSHAFHSVRMDPVLPAFEDATRGLERGAPCCLAISTVSGAVADDDFGRGAYWVRQLRAPVRFLDAVRAALRDGVGTVVEIGPHPVLSGLGQRALPELPIRWVASLRRGRDEATTFAQATARLYASGVVNDWSGTAGAAVRGRIELPNYPFQRSRFWLEVSEAAAPHAVAPSVARSRGLLGSRLAVAGAQRIFQAEAGNVHHAGLRDHRLNGRVVWPATATIEMALEAGRELHGDVPISIEGAAFLSPLMIPDARAVTVQTLVQEGPGTGTAIQLFAAAGGADEWRCFAEIATVGPASLSPPLPRESEGAPWSGAVARCGTSVSPGDVYNSYATRGIQFGPAFRTLSRIHLGSSEAVGHVCLDANDALHPVCLHPALLDGCFQLGFLATNPADAHTLQVPTSIARVTVFGDVGRSAWCHARVTDEGSGWHADFTVWNEEGTAVAEIEGLRVGTLRSIGTSKPQTDLLAESGYRIAWEPVTLNPVEATHQLWVVAGRDEAEIEALATALRGAGSRSTGVVGALDPVELDRAARALGGTPTHVAWCAGSSEPDGSIEDTVATLMECTHLVRHCACAASPPRVWIVTHDAQLVQGADSPLPTAAAVWGVGRVARSEFPAIHCSLLDLDPEADGASIAGALQRAEKSQTQLALRGADLFLARLGPLRGEHAWRLAATRPGEIERLETVQVERRVPGTGEVRIAVRSAGLNFRDVLCALGLYPGKVDALGGECSGVVDAVGPGVDDVATGDAVLAFAPGALGSSVIVPAAFVARKPDALPFDDAAALPVACLTAAYALEEVAALKAGERVLIHAAAGGVGLAAVQLAKRLGAQIHATAGSDAKRALLRSLGVEHVYDSRSLDFRDQVLHATQGAGVQVVLNSLAGEFVGASLAVVARDGRFLELGKRDVWSSAEVATRRPDVTYFAFDVGDEFRRDPALARRLLQRLMSRLASGELQALPVTGYAMSRPHEAFRRMAQGRHSGKIVLRQDLEPPAISSVPFALSADATYLISGGLGHLGLCTARALTERGARHLVLVGRSIDVPAAVQSRLEELRQLGAIVRVERSDVADLAQTRALMERLSHDMPPLRGIVHAVGVLDDATLDRQDSDHYLRVLAPKLQGASNLDVATRQVPLDFLVVYSAGAAWLGSVGQANYAAANSALDAFAQRRDAGGRRTLSIAWGRWSGGMAESVKAANSWNRRGIGAIEADTGFDAMFRLLASEVSSVGVMRVDWARQLAGGATIEDFYAAVRHESSPTRSGETSRAHDALATLRATPVDQRRGALRSVLDTLLRQVAGLPRTQRVDPRLPLRDLGMDSLMTVELRNAIARTFDSTFPATLVFDHPSLDALANHLLEVLPGLAVPIDAPRETASAASLAVDLAQLTDDEAEAMLMRELSGGEGA